MYSSKYMLMKECNENWGKSYLAPLIGAALVPLVIATRLEVFEDVFDESRTQEFNV